MNPAFASWHDFFAMGGYAFYVWLSVICTLVAMGALVVHTLLQRQRLLKEIRQRQHRERRIRAAREKSPSAVAGEQE